MKTFFRSLIFIITASYLLLTFLFASNGYPGFIQDSTCFLPTAYFINHFHQLINPLYDAGLDPVQHRFLFYPPLFPYTIALINNWLPEYYNNMMVTLTFIDDLSLIILLASVVAYSNKIKGQLSAKFYVFVIIWLIGLFSFYGVQEGRPEVLCKFFISCFLLNNIYQTKRFCDFNNGLLVGLNLITSPISTFYLMVITTGLLIYQNKFKLKPILQTLSGFAIVLGIFTIVYPYHLSELIQSLQKHSQNVIVNRVSTGGFKNFIQFYITYAYAPFLIVNFVLAVAYVGYISVKKNKLLVLGLLLILTVLVSYFSFKDMPMNYNMLVLSPLFFFVLFIIYIEISKQKISNLFFRTVTSVLVITLFVNSTGFIRKALLYSSTQDQQVSGEQFHQEFMQVYHLNPKNKKIAISFSLWPYCLAQYKNITMNNLDTAVKYEISQQLYSGSNQPKPENGFKLIKNNFITKHPKFWKIPLGNTYPWFQTAVYERK
ncbi:MAG: hypothetical protein EOP43_01650 [Sphingobacteriaceae bacterium]|nr:MAG: hypothetical protein EOP43_01650 [Sphingobacteriaceae bacterium]